MRASGTRIVDNFASRGGGIYNNPFGIVNLTASELSNNTATMMVGGLLTDGTQVTISQSCLVNNTGSLGSSVTNLHSNTTLPVDARYNWWGLSSGPTANMIAGPVLTSPFLTSPAAACR